MGSVILQPEAAAETKVKMATDAKDDVAAKAALNETLKEYINEWRKTREKEEEELKKLKEKQAKRKEIRAEKKKRLEEAEAKRQEMLEAQKADKQGAGGAKKAGGAGGDARREMTKTKEQLEEEKKIALSIRIKPLDLDSMDTDDLKDKAKELFNIVIALETDKYDYEQRRITQDYELNELKERQKAQLRQKALKKGLDPEAFSGKYPPP